MKTYVFDWRNRRIVITTPDENREVSFATLTAYERRIVGMVQASLNHMKFELVGYTDNGGWIYESRSA